jgi:hypothetical protein
MEFEKNIELDARMVLSAMKSGMDGIMNFAFRNRDIFDTPDKAVQRAYWLKEQDEDYIIQVSDRTAELEQQ